MATNQGLQQQNLVPTCRKGTFSSTYGMKAQELILYELHKDLRFSGITNVPETPRRNDRQELKAGLFSSWAKAGVTVVIRET